MTGSTDSARGTITFDSRVLAFTNRLPDWSWGVAALTVC